MTQDKNKILNDIIQKSGHDFHLKVSNLLKGAGWNVIDSPYYNDPDSSKAREIDIIAAKEFIVSGDNFFNKNQGEKLVIKLFIDCKYIKSPVVFWFKGKDCKKAFESAKDNPILEDKEDFYLNAKEIHHYTENNEIAWQWSSNNNDIISDAQHKVLKALIFYSEHQDSDYYEIRYPLIIVNSFDQLAKRSKDESENKAESIEDNFQIELNYSYKDKDKKNITKYFLIDVVSFPLLNDFMKKLADNDITLLKRNLSFDLRRIEGQNKAAQWDDDSF